MSQDYRMNITNESLQRYSDVDILSTQGRIGRKRYFVYSIVLPLILFWAIASFAGLTSYLPFASTAFSYAIIGVAMFTMFYMLVRLTIQRCHDFNKSGALALFAMIPLANIIFALIPGTNGLNQYGEVPKPANWLFKTSFYALILLLIGLMVFTGFQLINSQNLSNLFAF